MTNNFELNATKRENLGKAHSRRLRRLEGLFPAVVYGGKGKPVSINLDQNKINTSLKNEAFYSHILSLTIDGKDEQVVLKDMQRHPFKKIIMHMDFLRVCASETITMKVPLHFTNEDTAVGVKDGGKVSHIVSDLKIKCLPKDLPEFINVDVANLELDHSIHLSELTLPKGVELPQLSLGEGHDLPVVSIHKVKMKEISDEAPVATEVESETGNQDKDKESDAKSE